MLYLSILLFFLGCTLTVIFARGWIRVIFAGFSVIYLALQIFYFIADYFTGEGVTDSVFVQWGLGFSDAGYQEFLPIVMASTLLAILGALMIYKIFRASSRGAVAGPKWCGFVTIIVLALAIVTNPAFESIVRHMYSLKFNNIVDESLYRDLATPPIVSEVSDDHPNLIFVFGESLEHTYTNNDLFPGLLNSLSDIDANTVEFSNIRQNYGGENTISGIVSALCGVPLVTTSHSNSMSGVTQFYSSASCLSDVLSQQGYSLSYFQGSSLEFAGTESFLKSHSFESIHGKRDLLSKLPDPEYRNTWGIYDDSLLDIVIDEISGMDNSSQKHGIFLATVDTHGQNGRLSKSCKGLKYDDGSPKILNSIHCASKLISTFIESLKKTQIGQNAIVVLVSDHLMPGNKFSGIIDKSERKILFWAFDLRKNTHSKISVDKPGNQIDIGSTVLTLLGYSAKIGLGVDLLGKEKSTAEKTDDVDVFLGTLVPTFRKLWSFPRLEKSIKIDPAAEKLQVNNTTFKFPILIHFLKDFEVVPYFTYGTKDSLLKFLADINDDDLFLLVDKCKKIPLTNDLSNKSDDFCYIYGSLGRNLVSGVINNPVTIFKDLLRETKLAKKDEGNLAIRRSQLRAYELPKIIRKILETSPSRIDLFIQPHLLPQNAELIKTIENWCVCKIFTTHPPIGHTVSSLLSSSASIVEKYEFQGSSLGSGIVLVTPVRTRSPRSKDEISENAVDKKRFIAHAGGAIENHLYTNSLEALNLSYKAGFRYFELDIIQTRDGHYVAAHDWERWAAMSNFHGALPPTQQEFNSYLLSGKFTALDMNAINDWFGKHQDAILVTDKIDNPGDFSKLFIDKSRLNMELFSIEAVHEAKRADINSVMANWSVVSKFNQNKISKLKELGVSIVTASRRDIKKHLFDFIQLRENGIDVYVFHINKDEGYDERFAVCNDMNFVYGIYADKWDFNEPICDTN